MRFLLFFVFINFFFCGISIVFDANLIEGFNGLAAILHQFHEVNWLIQ